jgi:hypothetical protein
MSLSSGDQSKSSGCGSGCSGCIAGAALLLVGLVFFGIVGSIISKCEYAGKSVWDKLDRNTDENEVMQLIPQYAREWVAKNPRPNLDQLVEATLT